VVDPNDVSRDPLGDDALSEMYRNTRRPIGEHLSPDQWERLTCDELRGADFDGALLHIEGCSECLAIHRSLLALRSEATALEIGEAAPISSGGRRRWPFAAGLAAAAALVAAVVLNQPERTALTVDDTLRSGEARVTITAVTPAANTVISGHRFEWQPIASATTYEIRVHTADGTRVWSMRIDASSAEWPADVAASSGAYYWQVSALRGDAIIASSPMVPFRIN
jgi:hypothetical protein